MVPTYVINLRQDEERYSRLTDVVRKYDFVHLRRIDAVPGSTLPDQLSVAVTGHGPMVNNKGALGCTLSHVRAWEILLASSDEWALILEDDAFINDWSDLPAIVFPDGFDIIFANNRTEVAEPPAQGRIFTQLNESLDMIEKRKQAVGADCYILSRAGAEKLLSAFKEDGYGWHLDWRILAYCVSVEDVAKNLPDSSVLGILRSTFAIGNRSPFLNHFVLSPSLVSHYINSETSREREDRLGVYSAV